MIASTGWTERFLFGTSETAGDLVCTLSEHLLICTDWGYDGYLYVERNENLCGVADEVTIPLIK